MIALNANVEIAQAQVMPDGNIVYNTQAIKNLVVDAGLNLIRDALGSPTAAYASHLGVGSGTTAVSAAQTALATPVLRIDLSSVTNTSKAATLRYYLSSGQANGSTLREIGLFTAISGGTMIARALLASPIVKTASVTVTFAWTISLSAT